MRKYLFYIFLSVSIVFASCNQSKKVMADKKTMNKNMQDTNTLAQNPNRYQVQFEKGIDFIASGTEPFWSLEIDLDKQMHFKSVSGPEMITPAVKGVKAMDADITRYAAETEKGMLIVQLAKRECINDMSGEKFPFSVTVDIKLNTDSNYQTFKGCGQSLADYRLHDIWALESIDSKKIEIKNYPNGVPTFEFNLKESRAAGFTGCNHFNGFMRVMGNHIEFGRLNNETKSCNDLNENEYLQKFSGKTLTYTIDRLKLFITLEGGEKIVYKKVD